jgi:hypothetical protein
MAVDSVMQNEQTVFGIQTREYWRCRTCGKLHDSSWLSESNHYEAEACCPHPKTVEKLDRIEQLLRSLGAKLEGEDD